MRCRQTVNGVPNEAYIPHEITECLCLPAGGHCHGVRAATTDHALIDRWWGEEPRYGVGVACGPSGLVILDIDNHGSDKPADGVFLPVFDVDQDPATFENGWDTIAALCAARGAELPWLSPPTMAVQTPSGGLHCWFRVEDPDRWRQGAGRLGWQIDLKAGWGYGIVPGTVTRRGAYRALGDCRTVAPLPAWLAADLKRAGHYQAPEPAQTYASTPPKLTGGRGYVETVLCRELSEVAACRAGRNDQLTRSSFSLGQLVGAGVLDREAVHQALTEAAAAAGIDPGEAKAQSTIRRGLAAGAAKPRQVKIGGRR